MLNLTDRVLHFIRKVVVGQISQYFVLNFLKEMTNFHEFHNIVFILLESRGGDGLFTAGSGSGTV